MSMVRSSSTMRTLAVAVLLCAYAAASLHTIFSHCDTWDESTIIAIGQLQVRRGEFRVGPENPPLNGLLNSIPLSVVGVELPPVIAPERKGCAAAIALM